MQKEMKIFFEHVTHWDTKKLAKTHIEEIIIDEHKKEVMLIIDKLYAYNKMIENPHIYNLQESVKKAFWEDYSTWFKLNDWDGSPDRQATTPFTNHP